MERKKRTKIPPEIAALALFAAHRTCCHCREPGKRVHIHHVDEKPANNDTANLAVLCFDCHDDTQVAESGDV